MSCPNPKTSKLENFASTKFNRNKKKRNVLFCQKEGLKQHPEANKFSMKILGCHEFKGKKIFLAFFNLINLNYPVFKK